MTRGGALRPNRSQQNGGQTENKKQSSAVSHQAPPVESVIVTVSRFGVRASSGAAEGVMVTIARQPGHAKPAGRFQL
ncbi:MAG: hypothetical protein ABI682_02860 [Acidobacteriota bacterium]